jgi:hypothetical protein
MSYGLHSMIDRVAATEEKVERTTIESERGLLLYPVLLFRDQLFELEALASQRGEAVAAMIRSAVDAYLCQMRFK